MVFQFEFYCLLPSFLVIHLLCLIIGIELLKDIREANESNYDDEEKVRYFNAN